MPEPNAAEAESVRDSSVSSQIAEIKDSFERKLKALQTLMSHLRDLMIAMIENSKNSNSIA